MFSLAPVSALARPAASAASGRSRRAVTGAVPRQQLRSAEQAGRSAFVGAKPQASEQAARCRARARAGSSVVVMASSAAVGFNSGRLSAAQIGEKIKKYGPAGVLAYGLTNIVYYTCASLFVWTAIVKAPTGLGINVAAEKFLETLALVWAGSQVTKGVRAGFALALAKPCEQLLDAVRAWMDSVRGVPPGAPTTKAQVFAFFVCSCIIFSLCFFATVVLIWA